jgi:hypothetical protein
MVDELVVLIWCRDGQDPEKTEGAAWLFVALEVAMGMGMELWRGKGGVGQYRGGS